MIVYIFLMLIGISCNLNAMEKQIIELNFGFYKDGWVSKAQHTIEVNLDNTAELYASSNCLKRGYDSLSTEEKKSYEVFGQKNKTESSSIQTKAAARLGLLYLNIIKHVENGKVDLDTFLQKPYPNNKSLEENFYNNELENYIRINTLQSLEDPMDWVNVPLDLKNFKKLEKIKVTTAPWHTNEDVKNVLNLFNYLFTLPYAWCKSSTYIDYKGITETLLELVDRNTVGKNQFKNKIKNNE